MTLPQPFEGLIIMDAPIMDWDTFHSNERQIGSMLKLLEKGPKSRRDAWKSKAEAVSDLRRSFPYKTWDNRIFKLYVVRVYINQGGLRRGVLIKLSHVRSMLCMK
jgi:hypothetical protein